MKKKITKNYEKKISTSNVGIVNDNHTLTNINNIVNKNTVAEEIDKNIDKKKEEEQKIEEKKVKKIIKTEEEKKIEQKNLRKIKSKKKRLELLKQRQREYLDLVDQQKKKRESEMKALEEQIKKQNEKYSKLNDGESVSNTESIEGELNPKIKIENGFALLIFIFKNNLAFKNYIFWKN